MLCLWHKNNTEVHGSPINTNNSYISSLKLCSKIYSFTNECRLQKIVRVHSVELLLFCASWKLSNMKTEVLLTVAFWSGTMALNPQQLASLEFDS